MPKPKLQLNQPTQSTEPANHQYPSQHRLLQTTSNKLVKHKHNRTGQQILIKPSEIPSFTAIMLESKEALEEEGNNVFHSLYRN